MTILLTNQLVNLRVIMNKSGKASTSEKIHAAAIKEFGQYGFEGARIDRIARKARINKAMIYYHYKNKESLYESILLDLYTQLVSYISKVETNDNNPEGQLDAFIDQLQNFIIHTPEDYVRIMLREISSGGAYFIKLAIPTALIPIIQLFHRMYNNGLQTKKFVSTDPTYTFIHIMGAIFFFNAMRITLKDTDIGTALFSGEHFNRYTNNLSTVIKHGIIAVMEE